MPLTPPPIFEHVPSRTDNEDFDIRADEAWANLQLWLLFFVELVDLLNAALTAPIEALELTASPRLVGRTTAGAGPSEELTLAAVLALLQGDGSSSTAAGFRGIPVRTITGAASVIAGDNGGQLLHTDGSACSVTIPSNASLPLPVGFAVSFVNDAGAGAMTIGITSDTLVWAGDGGTGSRTLAVGMATATKTGATRWMIGGAGLT